MNEKKYDPFNLGEILNELSENMNDYFYTNTTYYMDEEDSDTDDKFCGCKCEENCTYEPESYEDEEFSISDLLEMLYDKMEDEEFVDISKIIEGQKLRVSIK